jgi:hypothetical protein
MIEDKFDAIVDNLRKRGSMYLVPYNYEGVINFLDGYHQAIIDFDFPEEGFKGMQELVTIKFGRSCAVFWPYIIKGQFAKDDQDAIKLFFLFYDQLVKLRRTKGIQFLKDEFEKLHKKKRKTNIYWPEKRQNITTVANAI